MSKFSTFIFGSCVSRDLARVPENKEAFKQNQYVARQSWISAFSNPVEVPSVDSKLSSKFQKRMVEADFNSSFPVDLLSQTDIDVLLLDLVDERLGVIAIGDSFITNSYELRNSGWKKSLKDPINIDFGTAKHLELWKEAADNLFKLLAENELLQKTFVIEANYADKSLQGDTFSHRKFPSEVRNEQYRPYYGYLREKGFNVLHVPKEYIVADKEHVWGLEPFHYVSEFYEFVTRRLLDNLSKLS